jgi:2',3'-cyclic-nucleotide 2'-phosphodiesterase (5'-nucleotidase family)
MFKVILPLLLLLNSCSYFVDFIDDQHYEVTGLKKKSLSLVFSHNINGETHPCGCRHFPLGGLPQVAGKFHELRKTNDLVYVDSGDMFFPSSVMPKTLEKSLTFGAENLLRGQEMLGLKYLTPGDQDLSKGVDFLKKQKEGKKFQYLISNLKDEKTLPHQNIGLLQKGPHKIFLVGIVWPESLQEKDQNLFENPLISFGKTLKTLKESDFRKDDPFHRLIIISHGGMDLDKKLAKKYPLIDWIIGSHSQSFTREPREESGVKMVQVLSRNHYLGEIRISLTNDKAKDKYILHEVREGLETKLKPNPLSKFIVNHKKRMTDLQLSEQDQFLDSNENQSEPIRTVVSCMECHSAQSEHWKRTPHALAYVSLINSGEENNLNCIKCHSNGLGKLNAFQRSVDIIKFDNDHMKTLLKDNTNMKEQVQRIKNSYWKKIKSDFQDVRSVRNLTPIKRQVAVDKWLKTDESFKVTHNYANVQCLNCHSKSSEHPFNVTPKELTQDLKIKQFKSKCLACHSADQSPEWYDTLANGLPGQLLDVDFLKRLKETGCPKN